MNNTWISITNNVLRQSGLPEIPNDGTTFNSPLQGLMTRYQLAAREYVRVMHEKISVDLPVGFARRRIELPIGPMSGLDGPGSIYALDPGISVESLTFNGFRNLSVAPPGPGHIRNWTYEYFTQRYPDITQIYTGAPTHYILLPTARASTSPAYQVKFFPNPDQNYSIEYIAQLNPYPLLLDTTVILWPPEYEHVLSDMARFSLEDLLGEGKGGSLSQQAEMRYQKARQKATQPRAEKKAVRMQKMFHRHHRNFAYYWYDSPPDSDAPYIANGVPNQFGIGAVDAAPYPIR